MSSTSSTVVSLAVAAAFAVAGSVALTRLGSQERLPAAKGAPARIAAEWSATASGRVEPMRGEVRLSAPSPGRIVEIAVGVNDRVRAGDLLLRLDDEDARARIAGAEAEVLVRKRERDAEPAVGRFAADRRQAEDVFFNAERALAAARLELERVLRARRSNTPGVTDETVQAERANVATALDRLEVERGALKRATTVAGLPLPTRVESGLTTARAELSLAEAAFERTRLRAPSDGTVLQVLPRIGETASATPEQTLIVLGDLSQLRVRAEVEERDVSKVRVGQSVVVKSDAFPGREFSGKVATLAQTLAPAKLSQRGVRRPTDADTLEVIIDLDPSEGLLSGMRVDVFFKIDQEPRATEAPSPTKQ